MYGKTHTKEAREKMSKVNLNKVNVIDENGKCFKICKYDKDYINNLYSVQSKGRKWSEKAKQNLPDRNNNVMAKHIGIFDNNNNLIFDCFGTFHKTIQQNDLPKTAFKNSLYNGNTLYEKCIDKVKNTAYHKYKGWYAKYLN